MVVGILSLIGHKSELCDISDTTGTLKLEISMIPACAHQIELLAKGIEFSHQDNYNYQNLI